MKTDSAKKIGNKTKNLPNEIKEDIGLILAVKKGRTGKYVNTDSYLQKLKNKGID